MNRVHFFWLVCIVAWMGTARANQGPPLERSALQVTYLGNEGIHVQAGSVHILLDALHHAGVPGYEAVPAATLARMEGAQAPFDRVSLILATHHHRDHFEAVSVARHLQANPLAVFIGAEQVAGAIRSAAPEARDQIREITPAMGKSGEHRAGGAGVRVLRLDHGHTQNTGFLVEVLGWKLLHLGDSDGTVANFEPFGLAHEKIDVAFIPYWYALDEESRKVVREEIAARHIIFFHIPQENPADARLRRHLERYGGRAGLVRRMQADFPNAVFFTQPLETRRW